MFKAEVPGTGIVLGVEGARRLVWMKYLICVMLYHTLDCDDPHTWGFQGPVEFESILWNPI